MENEKKNDAPFPQANDLNKVLQLVELNQEQICDNNYLMSFLNVTQRQVNYYLAACSYLGIIDRKRQFTDLGKSLKKKSEESLIIAIAKIIVAKPVFGEAFFNKFFTGEDLSKEEISELITFSCEIDNLEVADRRASTVKKWIDWIFDKRISLL